MKNSKKVPSLDIVINAFNVKPLVLDCLASIYQQKGKNDDWRVIVADMASKDGTVDAVRKKFPQAIMLASKKDLGFSKGNNFARKVVKAQNVLFLNPDTKIVGKVIQKTLGILEKREDLGAIGCKVMLPDSRLDYSCHRGLPTIWNSFCYFTKLSKLFPKSKYFSRYEATFLDPNESHEIDCITGAYLMIRKKILDKIDWWDEDYFWNGEDIEMCYQVKRLGYKIWYEASETIIHYKGSSSGLYTTAKLKVPKEEKINRAKDATRSMRIFIQKHFSELGPAPIVAIAWVGAWILEKYRLARIHLGLKYV
ncbi:MAG: glycosyltransferase [Microgenomates group bacterium]